MDLGGENDSLCAYVKWLRRALAENGVPFDRKKFSPHITLIRRAEFDRRRGFPGVTIPNLSMQASDVSLTRSDRIKSEMIHQRINDQYPTVNKRRDHEVRYP